MAGRGIAPKDPAERRNRTPPQRGEWIDLPPLKKPVIPALPKSFEVSPRTRAAYNEWRKDPVTTQYGPADRQLLLDTVLLYEAWIENPSQGNLASELRQRLDGLGLTPKGRQDRRWRYVETSQVENSTPATVVNLDDERRKRLTAKG